MNRRVMLQGVGAAAMMSAARGVVAQGGSVVFELRVYHTAEGKIDDLVKRFREHTDALFAKHGLKSVAYWTPIDEPAKSSEFIYILEHPSRAAAVANWKSFQEDPEWVKVRTASEANGKLVEKVDSTYMTLTDFSTKI